MKTICKILEAFGEARAAAALARLGRIEEAKSIYK